MIQWILASVSPRRRELLKLLLADFEVVPSRLEEDTLPGERPEALVRRLAQLKALAVQKLRPEAIIIGADTLVVCDEEVLGKPSSAGQATEMLCKLSGRTHQVLTGVCLLNRQTCVLDHSVTDVTFSRLSEEEIERYVKSGEPLDKAGGYAIQGIGARFIERIDGCYFNVVGLPVSRVYQMIRNMGYQQF
jgi:septum formation protein